MGVIVSMLLKTLFSLRGILDRWRPSNVVKAILGDSRGLHCLFSERQDSASGLAPSRDI